MPVDIEGRPWHGDVDAIKRRIGLVLRDVASAQVRAVNRTTAGILSIEISLAKRYMQSSWDFSVNTS
jgi:hypothetical protein